jgi:CRP/FNR family transcriptional regulator, cyclic AMP receptor protein
MVNPRPAVAIRPLLEKTVWGRTDPAVLDALCAVARTEHYDVPTLLNARGQPLEWLRLVVSGHVEIVARKASGDEVSLVDMGPGSWATWLACMVDAPPDHDFYSSAGAVYVALPAHTVRAQCAQHPALYPAIIAEMGVRMRQLMEWTGQSVLVGPEQRMAKLIHLLARTQAIGAHSGVLNATQGRLARMARCSRQSANQLLGALEARGLIRLAYGKFEIPDLDRLAAFAEDEGNSGTD